MFISSVDWVTFFYCLKSTCVPVVATVMGQVTGVINRHDYRALCAEVVLK